MPEKRNLHSLTSAGKHPKGKTDFHDASCFVNLAQAAADLLGAKWRIRHLQHIPFEWSFYHGRLVALYTVLGHTPQQIEQASELPIMQSGSNTASLIAVAKILTDKVATRVT